MSKITLSTVSSGFLSNTTMSLNFTAIANEFQNKVLYRNNPSGEPNTMMQDLDMNGYRVINALAQAGDGFIWRGNWVASTSYSINNLVTVTSGTYTGYSMIATKSFTSLSTFDLDYAAGNWNIFTARGASGAGTGDMLKSDNLLGLTNTVTARANLGAATAGALGSSGITGAVPTGSVTTSGLTESTNTILGRTTASTGAVEEITVGTNLTLAAGVLSANAQTSQGSLIGQQAYSVVTQTLTISIATPAVFTTTQPLLPMNNTPIVFTTTGALPTGLVTGTTYWVVNATAGGTTFNVSATKAGSVIATSGTQSGVHTANNPAYTKATNNPSFVVAEVWGAGGTGSLPTLAGAAGGYARKQILNATLGVSETVTIGAPVSAVSSTGGTSSLGSQVSATGGVGGAVGAAGGNGVGGDINLQGQSCINTGGTPQSLVPSAPLLNVSVLGALSGATATPPKPNTGHGASSGIAGACTSSSGLIIITEYR